MTVIDKYIYKDNGEKIGPFSTHWAAVAAALRCYNPNFKSLGSELAADLDLEKQLHPISIR